MNVKAPSRVDHWAIMTSMNGKGLQLMKNGRNIRFCTSFESAWAYVQNQGTPGDKISIRVEGELNVS